MLHVLAEPHAAGVRAHGQLVLRGHQHHCQNFVHAAEAARIDLHHVDGAAHDELLEHDAVLAHLARGHLHHRRDAFADLAVAFHVVGAGRLLDEPGLGKGELLHPVDGLVDLPDLVGVDHQMAVGPEHLARHGQAADVVLQVAPHLELDVVEARIDRLLRESAQLFVGVAEPAGRGGVAGVALGFQRGDALGLADSRIAQQHQRFFGRDAVGDVAKVDAAHQLFRAHVRHQLPHRLAFGLGPQVPHRIDHRTGRQVNRALVGADPAQLAVGGDVPPEAAHVFGHPLQVEPDDQVTHRLDGRAADLVAAPDGEGQAVAFEPRLVGLEHDVRRGVVRVGVHRVGAVELLRSGKAHVQYAHGSNDGHERGLRKEMNQSYRTAAILGSVMLVLSYQKNPVSTTLGSFSPLIAFTAISTVL
ncbi:hypothetical protein D9M72_391180 [compost metagenome]